MEHLGAAKKAIIFTESKRTQTYLLELLADTPYGDGIVLFNGTNSDQRAQAVYKDWLKRHEGTDRITGRSEEHTSELQSLMRISYAVFCLKKKQHKDRTQE